MACLFTSTFANRLPVLKESLRFSIPLYDPDMLLVNGNNHISGEPFLPKLAEVANGNMLFRLA